MTKRKKGQEEFEDTKEVIRFRKSKKDGQHNGKKKKGQEEFEDTKMVIRFVNRRKTDNKMTKRKKKKGQTTIYKTLHRNLKIEQHEHHK